MMKRSIKQILIIGLSTVALQSVSLVSADIYQWRDDSGGIQFGNKPPENNATVALISKTNPVVESGSSEVKADKSGSSIEVSKSSIFKHSRRSSLLFQGSEKDDKSRIISVRLLKESKDALIFDVNYYLSEKIDGTANIGIIPNMDSWSAAYTKAHPGRHATTIAVKLSNSGKSVIRSSSLKLSMALAKETGYVGSLFEHDLSFNKVWYKN
ncbi:MAG: DUF4124 domain-containing protein [Thiohalomonadales bacterium]